jgi:hypothetical protein
VFSDDYDSPDTTIGVPFAFKVRLPEGFDENGLPIEVPFSFYNDEWLHIQQPDLVGDTGMMWAGTLIRIADANADRAVEVVPYGDHTALILVYSTERGRFAITEQGDRKLFDSGEAVLKDVTGAGYVYRYDRVGTDHGGALEAPDAQSFYEKASGKPVYVYGVVVDADRLAEATGFDLLNGGDAAQWGDEAWVRERLTFDNRASLAAEDIMDYAVGVNVDGDDRTDAADETIVNAIAHGSRSVDGTATGAAKASNRFFTLTLNRNNASALRSDLSRPMSGENNARGDEKPNPYAKFVSDVETNLFINVWRM